MQTQTNKHGTSSNVGGLQPLKLTWHEPILLNPVPQLMYVCVCVCVCVRVCNQNVSQMHGTKWVPPPSPPKAQAHRQPASQTDRQPDTDTQPRARAHAHTHRSNLPTIATAPAENTSTLSEHYTMIASRRHRRHAMAL